MGTITDWLLQPYRTECKNRPYRHMMEGINDLNVGFSKYILITITADMATIVAMSAVALIFS